MDSTGETIVAINEKKSKPVLPLYNEDMLGPGRLFPDKKSDALMDRHWGLWPTLGFTALLCILYFLISGILAGTMLAVETAANPELDQNAFIDSLIHNGLYLSLSTLVTTWMIVGLIILFVSLRKGITIQEYLAFNSVPVKVILRWLGLTLLFVLLWDASYSLFGLTEPDFAVEAYRNSGSSLLFWIAIAIAAPVSEEFFFRGFVFDGIRGSKLGPIGAILITSVCWGLIHQQYGTYEIILISLLGVLFGVARIKTRSLYTSIALHCIFNLMAMLEVAAIS